MDHGTNSQQKQPWVLSTSCERELQELMQQIDRMVQDKKSEWENELKNMQNRLKHKEEQIVTMQQTLNERNRDANVLQQKLKECEEQHQNELKSLKREVSSLAKQYERLQKKHFRQVQELENKNSLQFDEIRQMKEEKNKLDNEFKSLRQNTEESQRNQLKLEAHVHQLKTERNSFEEKNRFLQEQSREYHNQLEMRKEMLLQTENTFLGQIQSLEKQLIKSKEFSEKQRQDLHDVKTNLAETIQQCESLFQNRDELQNDVEKARSTILRLESEVSRLTLQLKRRDRNLQDYKQQLDDCKHELQQAQTQLHQLTDEYDHLVQNQRRLSTSPPSTTTTAGGRQAAAVNVLDQTMFHDQMHSLKVECEQLKLKIHQVQNENDRLKQNFNVTHQEQSTRKLWDHPEIQSPAPSSVYYELPHRLASSQNSLTNGSNTSLNEFNKTITSSCIPSDQVIDQLLPPGGNVPLCSIQPVPSMTVPSISTSRIGLNRVISDLVDAHGDQLNQYFTGMFSSDEVKSNKLVSGSSADSSIVYNNSTCAAVADVVVAAASVDKVISYSPKDFVNDLIAEKQRRSKEFDEEMNCRILAFEAEADKTIQRIRELENQTI